jgi:hypothetical protein
LLPIPPNSKEQKEWRSHPIGSLPVCEMPILVLGLEALTMVTIKYLSTRLIVTDSTKLKGTKRMEIAPNW